MDNWYTSSTDTFGSGFLTFVPPPAIIIFILEFGNYFLLCSFFYFAKKYKIINSNLFYLALLMMLTPFLINDFLFSWTRLPDQSKYALYTRDVRSNIFDPIFFGFLETHSKVKVSSFIFGHTPLLSLESYKSIGFLNRFYYVVLFLFIVKKNYLPFNIKLLAIFSPSLIIYSSVSLRDSLILVIMVLITYLVLKRSYILTILFGLIMYFIKPQNLFLIFCMIILIKAFVGRDSYHKAFFKYLIFAMVILCILNVDLIMETFNSIRVGLYIEQYGYYKSVTATAAYQPLVFNYEFLKELVKANLNFLTSPIKNPSSIFHIILIAEAIIIYCVSVSIFYKDFKIIKLRSIINIWIMVILISISLYSLLIFNDGQITRYRFVLLYWVIFGYEIHKNIYLKEEEKKI